VQITGILRATAEACGARTHFNNSAIVDIATMFPRQKRDDPIQRRSRRRNETPTIPLNSAILRFWSHIQRKTPGDGPPEGNSKVKTIKMFQTPRNEHSDLFRCQEFESNTFKEVIASSICPKSRQNEFEERILSPNPKAIP
jgi:hypothetical protein